MLALYTGVESEAMLQPLEHCKIVPLCNSFRWEIDSPMRLRQDHKRASAQACSCVDFCLGDVARCCINRGDARRLVSDGPRCQHEE